MGARERLSADACIEVHPERPQHFDVDRTLHVSKLAPIEEAVVFYAFRPAEEDVARGLHHPLAVHDPFARLAVAALRQVVFEHRPRRLLHLQEQGVVLIAALQQADVRTGPDTADPDDLARHVDQLELLEQVAPIVLQRGAVRAQQRVDAVLDLIG